MVGAYKVHAAVNQDSNDYYHWYMSVYDVGRDVGDRKTVSSHYYWVQSLTNRDVYDAGSLLIGYVRGGNLAKAMKH